MKRLPYIDEHVIRIGAPPDDVWNALPAVLKSGLDAVPRSVAHAWGLTPATRRGDWSAALRPGDSVPGFEVADVDAGRRLALRGSHRFSRYALVFTLERSGADACILRAQSWGEFPGATGAAYRALVIGTRGHRIAVGRLLGRVERSAERGA